MSASAAQPFQCVSDHQAVAAIIRRHSTNTCDIRELALRHLNLRSATAALDLGCGFGFMSEALACRLHSNAWIVGVDRWASNRAPFLHRIAESGRRGQFTCMSIDEQLPWADDTFDVAVCSYSLYFFADVLPEVARILRPTGLFLAITHSQRSVAALVQAAGMTDDSSELLGLTGQFSAENGDALLRHWFDHVEQIDYRNTLRFEDGDEAALHTYLRFKLPLLIHGAQPGDPLPAALIAKVQAAWSAQGSLAIEKNDTIFRCRSPQCL